MEGKAKQILIADDEPDILEIIRYNLEKEGYEVHTAKDGNEAIEKAKQLYPDLIILDIVFYNIWCQKNDLKYGVRKHLIFIYCISSSKMLLKCHRRD